MLNKAQCEILEVAKTMHNKQEKLILVNQLLNWTYQNIKRKKDIENQREFLRQLKRL